MLLIMDFSQKLVLLRKEKGLTQKALAEIVSLHFTQIQRYESGSTQPTLEVIKNLAIALSVSADTLIFDKSERMPDELLRLQFEAIRQFDEQEKQTAQDVLEGLILKHQAKQSHLRQLAAKNIVS
jgi:transcriptional regulator with XRE-family HTH domain